MLEFRVWSFLNGHQHHYCFHVTSVVGATAYGSVSNLSSTGSRKKYLEASVSPAERGEDRAAVVVQLGWVDIGNVVWMRAKKAQVSVTETMRHSVDRLILFLKSLVSKFFPPDRIIVALPVLPESGQMPVAI
jgi:hypothetical protein